MVGFWGNKWVVGGDGKTPNENGARDGKKKESQAVGDGELQEERLFEN